LEALVGLGNPGEEYRRTRHNAGWMLLAAVGARGREGESRSASRFEASRVRLGPRAIWLVRPTTFMNLSGGGVTQACERLGLGPRDLVVAYDDVDLPLGTLRLRPSGGSGGHRGLQSIVDRLGTQRIARIRLGVRGESVKPHTDTADYVLSPFATDEEPAVEEMIDRAADAVTTVVRRDFKTAMNQFNVRPARADQSGHRGAEGGDPGGPDQE
jgi:PTH1 family peptidyl-tRNA hydrolase